STCTAPSPPKACGPPAVSPWVPSSPTNSLSWLAQTQASTCASVSRPSSKLLEIYDQASISPPPSTNSGRGDLPAYVSNGLIGLRVRDFPLRAGVAIV